MLRSYGYVLSYHPIFIRGIKSDRLIGEGLRVRVEGSSSAELRVGFFWENFSHYVL